LTYQIAPLTAETFGKLRDFIYETTNINMREGKQILVSNRLRKRVVALKLDSYEEYYRYLTGGKNGASELRHFIDAVSTNETYFYRETNHLDVMRETIFPELFARKHQVVLWSAGCSTGEEPYTLRIAFEEGLGTRWKGDLRIVATDISSEVVERAKEGDYRDRSVRFVPPHVLEKYFVSDGTGGFQVKDALRSSIEFKLNNLLKDPPPVDRVDVIFCRNVMIYFDKETQQRLADDYFAPVLDPKGYLCIGHSESLSGTSRAFQFIRGMKAPVYQFKPNGSLS
ncbi:MAG TPA: protein-glutamate O-methyltransferase CheR, partial [Spirochaetia bacterium]|nr:protein-glutamate O-methyltransferase CheR [Spirochaetia bacterium]